ncbi:MAG: cupin domain-containing protein [bacterium]
MDVLRHDRSKTGPPDRPEYFSGAVRTQNLRRPSEEGEAELIAVFFDAGARTIPHAHATDQVLYFVEGEGIVATELTRRILGAGEIAVIPGGVWHWHGATKATPVCHISIKAVGPTNWDLPKKNWNEY